MGQPRYEAAEALVYDPVASNRSATRAALRSLGFGGIEIAPSLASLTEQITSRTPHLLLCELGGAENDVCAAIQSVRQGQLGNDPFLVIVATTWRRDDTVVRRAINCGADDVLARPFSAALLGERLNNLIERRKDFVVTGDYVGPDRRRDPARAGLPCILVPNALGVPCASGLSTAEADERFAGALREARRTVNAEKMRRDATQVFQQWQAIEQRRQANRDASATLGRLAELSADIARRAPRSPFAAATEVARTLAAAAKLLAGLPSGDGRTADGAAAYEKMTDAISQLRQIIPADSDDPVAAIDQKTLRVAGTPAAPNGSAAQVIPLARRAAG